MDITYLLKKLNKISPEDLFEIEPELFAFLCQKPVESRLPYVNAYLTISGWRGTSLRSGVWTFYEAATPEEMDAALQYLKQTNQTELAEIFEKGIHDYQNPIYGESFDYPEEWMEESEEIDCWIMEHEDWLRQWEYRLLIDHISLIAAL